MAALAAMAMAPSRVHINVRLLLSQRQAVAVVRKLQQQLQQMAIEEVKSIMGCAGCMQNLLLPQLLLSLQQLLWTLLQMQQTLLLLQQEVQQLLQLIAQLQQQQQQVQQVMQQTAQH
jgi:hypothetical protein